MSAQLSLAEAEVGRLTETQRLAQEEWSTKHGQLKMELTQATSQKLLLSERVEFLESKVSSLLPQAEHEELPGESMGPFIEVKSLF